MTRLHIEITDDQYIAAVMFLDWSGGTTQQVMEAIELIHEYPPIPDRTHDWLAQFRHREEGPQGWGRTQEEALADLFKTVESL